MATLTIFANFYINSEERFLRMQDSFHSFKDIDAVKWVINVRGPYKFDTLFFLHDHLGNKLVPYLLESKQGWFYDTQQMLKDINSDYVLLWVEDHLNLTPPDKYNNILSEMLESGSEYMCYSWWHFGNMRKPYEHIPKKEWKNISTFILNKENQRKIRENNEDYIISMVGIFSSELFKKIVLDKKIYPRQWPKFTPLNFEKRPHETRWLPVRYALPKYELFACIDDGGEGYSLQSRGMYPTRVLHEDRGVRNPITPTKIFFRSHIRKYIPDGIYDKKIKIGNVFNRFIKYVKLLIHGE